MHRKDPRNSSREERLSDLLALEQARYELSLFELSRPHRLAKAFNKFRENPLQLPAAFKEMASALRSVPKPNPPGDNKEFLDSLLYPLPIHTSVNTLVYPRLKVGVIGSSLSEFGTVAHTFRAGDSNWTNMLDFGIDVLAIYLSSYRAAHHEKYVKQAKTHSIKVLVIKDRKSTKQNKLLQSADLVISQYSDGLENDMPSLDVTEHNPVNLTVKKGNLYSTAKVSGGIKTLLPDKFNILKANDILYLPNKQLSHAQHCTLIRAVARGTIVIAGDKKVVEGAIQIPSGSDAEQFMKELNGNLELKLHYGVRQRRETILNRSQIRRFEYIANLLWSDFEVYKPKISIILSSRRPEYTEQILDYISTFPTNHMDIEVVFVAHGSAFDTAKVKQALKSRSLDGTVIPREDDTIFGDNLNVGLEHANGDFVAKLDDDDLYGKHHLEDVLAAYYYSGADIVGKWSHWIYFEDEDVSMTWVKQRQESYVAHLPGGTFLCKRDFLKSVGGFGKVSRGIDSELYRRVRPRGGRLYSTHKYNYVRVRHGVEHTYNISHEDFKTQCSPPEIKGKESNKVFA